MKKKSKLSSFRNLIFFTQLGLSVVSPIIVCVVIGILIKKYWAVSDTVFILLILFGLLSGLSSAWQIIKRMIRMSEEEDQKGEDSP